MRLRISHPRAVPAGLAAVVLLLCSAFAAAETPAGGPGSRMPAVSPAADAPSPAVRRSRLRFRGNGPTCMCADGLGERDIRRAEAAARASTITPSTEP